MDGPEKKDWLLDERLLQSQKLAAIGELSAGIAHEINNPLAIIRQEAEWMQHLLKKLAGGDGKAAEELQGSVQQIVQQVDRCTEITRNLLDFARKRDPVIQAVEVNRIIENMTMLVEKEARHNNITIVRHYDETLPPIYSDAPQLRQVILNFLTNATQAIGKDGVVTITTRLSPMMPWTSSSAIRAAASRQTTWARSSTRFSPPSRRARAPGWGCPSATGSFSGWGDGSRWQASWARARSSPSRCPEAGNRSCLPMPKPRILLVDDEERFRANLEKMLGAQGLAVRAVGSGAEALEELKLHPCDVIVLDIRMPGMDGLATLAEIKRLNPEVEVIILSGHASMDAAMEINKLGGYDYLMKPCPLEELLLKIEAAYERKVEREKRTKKSPPPAETA